MYKGSLKNGIPEAGRIYQGYYTVKTYSSNYYHNGEIFYNSFGFRYSGEIHNGMPHGYGLMSNGSDKRYEGNFVAGLPNGIGKVF
jgi:hypothetical protein